MECFESAVPANFVSYAPTFFSFDDNVFLQREVMSKRAQMMIYNLLGVYVICNFNSSSFYENSSIKILHVKKVCFIIYYNTAERSTYYTAICRFEIRMTKILNSQVLDQ